MNILMIEDDVMIAGLLQRYLSEYAEVSHFIYPLEALELLQKKDFDIVILDLTLPQIDGLEVCKMIQKSSNAKVIISSARSDINDKLFAFENGADDYLPKPYDPRELYARIKLLYERGKEQETLKKFVIDKTKSIIYFNENALVLTLAEYEIMQLFIKNPHQAFNRTDIANSISAHRFDSGLESINVLVGRLRKKIEPDYKNPIYIKTVRGFGYRFSE